MSQSSNNQLEALMDIVRGADRERYLAALYAPQEKRADLLAIYAFHAEISGIRDRVSQALPGEIRLQWWRDVLEDRSVGAGNPVAETLMSAIERHGLPRQAFQNYLDARIFDLYDDPMPTRGDLEGYCGETSSMLIQLSSMVLDGEVARKHSDLAGHAGCAQAITSLLRVLPLHRRRGQCYVPTEILSAAGTTRDVFVAGDGGPQAEAAVAMMVALAREHLSIFERSATELPQVLRPAFLPLSVVALQLAKMQTRESELLTSSVDVSLWRKHWAMFRTASRGWN